jgi:hypothetical protein
MRSFRFLSFFIVSISCIVFVFSAYAEEKVSEKQLQTSDKKEKVFLVVEQSYAGTMGVSLPFEDPAIKMLEYAGLEVGTEDTGEYDYVLKIEVEGRALSQEYSFLGFGKGTTYYTGAFLNGKIIFELAGISFFEASFSGRKPTPKKINTSTAPKAPSSAPFGEAMESSSFLYELIRMLGELYGPYPVVAALQDVDLDVRKKSARVLQTLGPTAAPALIAALKDTDTDLQSEATNILVHIGAAALDPLLAALEEKNPNVRKSVVIILGEIGEPQAVEPLIASLKDKRIFVRKVTSQSLEKITGQSFGKDRDAWLKWMNEQKIKN